MIKDNLRALYYQNRALRGEIETFFDEAETFVLRNFDAKEKPVIKQKQDITKELIESAVCGEFDIEVSDLYVRDQSTDPTLARFTCYHHLKEEGWDLKTIANNYGGDKPYNHASIINGISRVDSLRAFNVDFRNKFNRIEQKLKFV